MDSIYFDIEKDITDDNIKKMFKVVQLINDDLERFFEIEMKVLAAGKATTPIIRNYPIENDQNVYNIKVDINKNFNMLTAFGSFPMVELMEHYVFDVCYPALKNFFICNMPIKGDQESFYKVLFQFIQKITSFAKKNKHFENAQELFKVIKEQHQLKKFGTESMDNKQLRAW